MDQIFTSKSDVSHVTTIQQLDQIFTSKNDVCHVTTIQQLDQIFTTVAGKVGYCNPVLALMITL